MNLELELKNFEEEKKQIEKNLEKVENANINNKTTEQLEARERVINSYKKEIEEIEGYIKEIKEELGETEETEENIGYDEKELIEAIKNNSFVSIVCEDGHEHTIKAYNNLCGTPFFDEDDLTSQLKYCRKISLGFDIEILTANSFEEAIEEDIITEEGMIK